VARAPPPVTTPPVISPSGAAAARVPPVAPNGIDPTKAYFLFFDTVIDPATTKRLRQQLITLVEGGVSNITLVLSSPGGQVDATMQTYGLIRALPARINTHAQGFISSSATVLFLAGEERSADATARFLFHPPSSIAPAGSIDAQQVRDRLAGFQEVTDVLDQVYRSRTSLPQSEIERFNHEAVVYTAEQARGYGIVGQVADLHIPPNTSKIILLD
jgi:ATP-dependent protease ClpP protease subunit